MLYAYDIRRDMKNVTVKMRRRILALYFEDDRKPIKIYRMTGVPLERVREVIREGYRHPSIWSAPERL